MLTWIMICIQILKPMRWNLWFDARMSLLILFTIMLVGDGKEVEEVEEEEEEGTALHNNTTTTQGVMHHLVQY